MAAGLAGKSRALGVLNKLRRISSLVITDSFTGTDGTSLNGRTTETGNKVWTVEGGSVTIQNNTAQLNNPASGASVTLDPGFSDYSELSIKIGQFDNQSSGEIDFFFRYLGQSSCLGALAGYNSLKIFKKAPTYEELFSVAQSLTVGDVVKIVASGSTISLYYNNSLLKTITETYNQSVTPIAVGVYNSNNASIMQVDDFKCVQ